MINNFILKTDNDNEIYYTLNKYSINTNNDELLLELCTKEETLQYLIHTDTREPNLSDIKDFLAQQLDRAISGTDKFVLSEYLQRMYIFVGNEKNIRQFTATKK